MACFLVKAACVFFIIVALLRQGGKLLFVLHSHAAIGASWSCVLSVFPLPYQLFLASLCLVAGLLSDWIDCA